MTLTEFLFERLKEDEADARTMQAPSQVSPRGKWTPPVAGWSPHRVIQECEAKHSFILYTVAAEAEKTGQEDPAVITEPLRRMAKPYRQHPQYDDAWWI